jgi:hypothetical protein
MHEWVYFSHNKLIRNNFITKFTELLINFHNLLSHIWITKSEYQILTTLKIGESSRGKERELSLVRNLWSSLKDKNRRAQLETFKYLINDTLSQWWWWRSNQTIKNNFLCAFILTGIGDFCGFFPPIVRAGRLHHSIQRKSKSASSCHKLSSSRFYLVLLTAWYRQCWLNFLLIFGVLVLISFFLKNLFHALIKSVCFNLDNLEMMCVNLTNFLLLRCFDDDNNNNKCSCENAVLMCDDSWCRELSFMTPTWW